MIEINIDHKGKTFKAIVDDNQKHLKDMKWHIQGSRNIYYARTYLKIKDKWIPKQMHHFIIQPKKGNVIDHKNHNGLDNREGNLRECTISQNNMNSRKNEAMECSSKYKGVHKRKSGKSWTAAITIDGKQTYIGKFKTELEAGFAYNEKAIEIYKKYACLNSEKSFIDDYKALNFFNESLLYRVEILQDALDDKESMK